MNATLQAVDPLVVSRAELELFRLFKGNSLELVVRWECIKAFQEILSTIFEKSNDEEVREFIKQVIDEFYTCHLCRRRIDTITSRGILFEITVLIQNRSANIVLAERLYSFCYLFSKHIEARRNVEQPVPNVVIT